MHEKLLSAAVLPMPYRILGLDMMPYSLGCELQLFREDSPFLVKDRADFDALTVQQQCLALIRAVNICCRRAPLCFRLWSWMYVPRTPEILALAIADFRNYLAGGRLQFRSDLPSEAKENARYMGEPEILRLYRFVNAHVPRAEIELHGQERWHFPLAWDKRDVTAWDFPYSFAKMLSQGHAEAQGNLEIYNIQKKTHDDYHAMSEAGRVAWFAAKTDAEKRTALEEHPIIRELPDVAEQLAEFESLRTATSEKGDLSCPA